MFDDDDIDDGVYAVPSQYKVKVRALMEFYKSEFIYTRPWFFKPTLTFRKVFQHKKTLKETIQLTYKMKRTATIDSQFFNSKHVILIKILLKPCTNPFT